MTTDTESALWTKTMPHNERALLEIFDAPPGSVGLLLDVAGAPIGAWRLAHFDSTEGSGYAFTTATSQDFPWVTDDSLNPLTWLYGKDAPEWEGNEVPVYEITKEGILDLSKNSDGSPRAGDEIGLSLQTAESDRFFSIGMPGDEQLCTRSTEGVWGGSGCGGDIVFQGPYPHTDQDLLAEILDECGYDTPFLEPSIPSEVHKWDGEDTRILVSVDSVSFVGQIPGQ